MRHTIARLAAIAALAVAFLAVAPAQPVASCSIGQVPGPPPTRDELLTHAAENLAGAAAVFRGRVIAESGTGPGSVTFETDAWWKGRPATVVAVRTAAHGCGYAFTPGAEYIVYADAGRGFAMPLEVRPGTASHPAPTTDVEDEVFGAGVPPVDAGSAGSEGGRQVPWAGLVVGGLAGVSGVRVVGGRGRRR